MPPPSRTARVPAEVQFLTYAEINALTGLVRAAGGRSGAQHAVRGRRLMALTGIRIGEALTLRREDVDLAGRRVYVERTMTVAEAGERVIRTTGTPKTRKRRAVPITRSTADAIDAAPARALDRTLRTA